MKIDMKEVVKPAVILFVICLITTVLLSGTNLLTQDTIAQQEKRAASESRQKVLPTAKNFEASKDASYYVGKTGTDISGYVFTTSSSSYGGTLQVMTGISNEGKVTGVEILSINDTPGLGMNAQKQTFRDQYTKPSTSPAKDFTVIKSGTAKDGEILAMTGATITSKAVTDAVNQAVTQFEKVKGGE